MEKFIIESPHTTENCQQAIRDIHAAGYLHHFEWGCKDNCQVPILYTKDK